MSTKNGELIDGKVFQKIDFLIYFDYVLKINTPISADTVRGNLTIKRFGVGQAKCRFLRELSFNA